MEIGKVVGSQSHITYFCQVYALGETDVPVRPADYALGRLVSLEQPDGTRLVGLLTDTLLINPDLNNRGPRLYQREDMEVFTPDYLAEKVTLVHITLIGLIRPDGGVIQGYPLVSALIDTPVRLLTESEITAFHHPLPGRLAVGYFPLLLATRQPLMLQVLEGLLADLMTWFPREKPRLKLLSESLAWQTRIEPMTRVDS